MSLLFLNIKAPSYNITENFNSSEIIKASHSDDSIVFIEKRVVDLAQYIRTALNKAVIINSAYRSHDHNEKVGGAENSQHLLGKALDLKAPGIIEFMEKAYETKNEHWVIMYDLGLRGIGFYSWGVHIDVRESISVAHWDYRKKKAFFKALTAFFLLLFMIFILKSNGN